jgi:hypothetical protein
VGRALHSSRTVGSPALRLIPYVKSSARQPYESPTAGYVLSAQFSDDLKRKKKTTCKLFDVHFGHTIHWAGSLPNGMYY